MAVLVGVVREITSVASGRWTLANAKAKLDEVVEKALTSGPQRITMNGRVAVVVVSADEWDSKTRRPGNLAEFFASSPLRDSGLKTPRRKDGRRETEL
jgi:prevent-host-death family protein